MSSSAVSLDYPYYSHETSSNRLTWRVYCCVRCSLLLILLGFLWTCTAITLLILFGLHKSHYHTFLIVGAVSLITSVTMVTVGIVLFKRYYYNPQSTQQSGSLDGGYTPPTVAASGSSGQLYSGHRHFRPLGNDPDYSEGFVPATSPIYIANYSYLPMTSATGATSATAKQSNKKRKKSTTMAGSGAGSSSGPRLHVYSPIYDDRDRI